jgi:hypothetical protein
MSFTRLDYDTCAYAKDLQESTTPLEYLMFKGKFENCKQCPDYTNNIDFGVKADVESELRNQNRYTSKCPSNKYDPTKPFAGAKTTNPHVCERIPSGLKKPTCVGYDASKLGRACCPK